MAELYSSGHHAGCGRKRTADAPDKNDHAGSDPTGLYAHRPCKGLHPGAYDLEACAEKCDSAGADRDGNQLRLHSGRSGDL